MTPDPADPLDRADPGMSSKSAESDGVLFKNRLWAPKWVPKFSFSYNFKFLHNKLNFREIQHKFKNTTTFLMEKNPAGMMSPKEGLG